MKLSGSGHLEMIFGIITYLCFKSISGLEEARNGAACASTTNLPQSGLTVVDGKEGPTASGANGNSAQTDKKNEPPILSSDPFQQCEAKLDYLLAKFKQFPTFQRLNYEEDFSSRGSSGHFGTVKFYRELATGRKVAIKEMICKSSNPEEELQEQIRFIGVLESVSEEIDILREITARNVPFVTQLFGAFVPQDVIGVQIAMSRVRGTDLRTVILDMAKADKRFPTRSVALIIAQMALALSRLHRLNILHKDVKADNIVVDYEIVFDPIDQTTTYRAKQSTLVDFGLAEKLLPEKNFQSLRKFGAARYFAPERASKSNAVTFGTPVDVWSLGIVMYAMIAGDDVSPFDHDCENKCRKKPDDHIRHEIIKNIERLEVDYPEEKFSEEEMDLVNRMLTKDPAKRITASKILEHPWFAASGISIAKLKREADALAQAKSPDLAHFESVANISVQSRRGSRREKRPPLPPRRSSSSSSSSYSSNSSNSSSASTTRRHASRRRRTAKRRDKTPQKEAIEPKGISVAGLATVGLNFTKLWNETLPRYKPTAPQFAKNFVNNFSTSVEKIAKYVNNTVRYRV